MSESGRPVVLCLAERPGSRLPTCAAQELGAELCVRKGVTASATQFSRTAPFLREVFLARRSIVGSLRGGDSHPRACALPRRQAGRSPGSGRLCRLVQAGSPSSAAIAAPTPLASRLAAALGGHAAITTAGDLRFGVALDEPPPGWSMVHGERAGPLTASLLAGGSLSIGGARCQPRGLAHRLSRAGGSVGCGRRHGAGSRGVPWIRSPPRRAWRRLHPRLHPRRRSRNWRARCSRKQELCPRRSAAVFSLDLKADEPAVIRACKVDAGSRPGSFLRLTWRRRPNASPTPRKQYSGR